MAKNHNNQKVINEPNMSPKRNLLNLIQNLTCTAASLLTLCGILWETLEVSAVKIKGMGALKELINKHFGLVYISLKC